jgi:tRNA threonylcarbamoyl adenosine modification protein (Sua5/YciO/YrdC/YwlC family)
MIAAPMQLAINARNPEPRKIARAVEALRQGGVIAYPTDTVYGLGCDITNKHAVERIYRMKRMADTQLLSFVCPDLSNIAHYGVVQDFAYRIMRRLVPGPYTFILQATREVPKVLRMKRKTVGIRVPDHPVALALARELGSPVASTSASLEGEILIDPADIEDRFPELDLVLDAEGVGLTPSTVLDLSGDAAVVVREGAGPLDVLHL